jgi:ribosome maturation factor RimP
LIHKDHIQQLAAEHFNNGPLFITGIKIGSDNQINVFLDGDNGVTISDCVALSRYLEKNLDRDTQDFSLDVSSHGALNPLVSKRQYAQHVGREVAITLVENNEVIEGTLTNFVNDELTIEHTAREDKPIGKGKITVTHQRVIHFDKITETKIKLKF